MDNMTIFGWITVGLWFFMAVNKQTEPTLARILCLFMLLGTLGWGTGSL